MIDNEQKKKWIIQRCLNAFKNEYEDWLGFCENLMTSKEMKAALKFCNEKWPGYELRGHNVKNTNNYITGSHLP